MGDRRHHAPTLEAVRALILEALPSPSITIYMPTHKAGAPPAMREDRLRFKNLSQRATEIAREQGADSKRVRALQRRLRAILDDLEFWEHQSESLVACVSPQASTVFNLPVGSEEHVVVDVRFHLAPVIGLLGYTQPYYVLHVTQKDPAIFKGDMYRLTPMDLPLPRSTGDALRIDEWKEGILQFHPTANGTGAGAQWHGQGGAKDRGDNERRIYLKMTDHVICNRADTSCPLILAGTSALTEEFRRNSHYPYIVAGNIPLNSNTQDMFAAARQKMYESVIAEQHRQLAAAFKQQLGINRAASEAPAIEDALRTSNVGTVLLGILHQTADTARNGKSGYSAETIKLPSHDTMAAIDYLATRAWCLGSDVALLNYTLLRPHLLAALYRY